jgi:two-component system chemotaxis response regulator CheB
MSEQVAVSADGQPKLVGVACPECSGSLTIERQGSLVKLQCRVGHVYSPQSFLAEYADTLERTLWAAVRLLEEGAAASEFLTPPTSEIAGSESDRRERLRAHAETLRRVLAEL